MSSRQYSLGWYFLLSGMACCGLLEGHALAQGTHQPKRVLGLSETNSAEILTNLNSLTTRQEGVNQLEDQFGTLTERRSLEDRLTMPYVPRASAPVSSKALKGLLDRQKNWGLSSEELGGTKTATEADTFSAFDDHKQGKSSLQEFYETLNSGNRRQGASRSPDPKNSFEAGKSSDSKLDGGFDETANLPPGLRDKADKLKDTVKDDATSMLNPAKRQTSFENFFGLDRSNPVAQGVEGRKSSMETFVDQFKQVLNGPSGGPAALDPALNSLLPETAARRASVIPSIGTFHSAQSLATTEATTPGTVSLVPNATIVPDLNAATLNRWNPLFSPSKLEVPKITPPAPPNVDFPRRHF
jgi:hypothetical protein